MRAIKLKCTEASGGVLTLQHPGAKPGFDGRVQTFEVTAIPDGVADGEVVRLANLTCFGCPQRYSARFDELGPGHILRGGVS